MSARWSLRSRLIGAVLAATAAIFVALAALLFVVVRQTAWQQHDDALLARARALAEIAEHDDQGYEMALPPEPAGQPAAYTEVWTRSGAVLARSPALRGDDLPRTDGPLGAELSDLRLPDGRAGRMVVLRFFARDEARTVKPEPLVLVLAEGSEPVDAAVASVRRWFFGLGVAGLVVIAALTAWLVGRGLRPLAVLATRIEQIDDRRLATRLSVADQPRELQVPINKLNALLERLEASFARERQFTADVSHELRTPLSGLRTLLEVTSLADRSTAEYGATLASALEVVNQLGAVVENLLALARLDGGRTAIVIEDVALRTLVDECWKPHAAIAHARALRFSNLVPVGSIEPTDREKLRIVLGNLLANAAEYTEAGGWVAVAVPAGGLVEVADSGPAIPDGQLERVFDRLWRGDAARAATGVHCGIGLALARGLCDRLELALTATSTPVRVCFAITRR